MHNYVNIKSRLMQLIQCLYKYMYMHMYGTGWHEHSYEHVWGQPSIDPLGEVDKYPPPLAPGSQAGQGGRTTGPSQPPLDSAPCLATLQPLGIPGQTSEDPTDIALAVEEVEYRNNLEDLLHV